VRIVHEVKVSGSYYDIGLNMGKLLKKERIEGFPPKFSKENLDKGMEFEKEAENTLLNY